MQHDMGWYKSKERESISNQDDYHTLLGIELAASGERKSSARGKTVPTSVALVPRTFHQQKESGPAMIERI